MMMNFETVERMMNGSAGWMFGVMWINYLIFLTLAILGIAALLKYLKK